MALENYTRGQKIFMVTLVVFLAALFTVTGAMVTIVSGGQSAPPDHGQIDGEYIRMMEFQRLRRALNIVSNLDRGATPSDPDAPEHLYARVPTLSVRPDHGHDYPYNAVVPRETSLLEVWPRYQDQHVWSHVVLAERAREAGIEKPGNTYLGRVITALMNESMQEADKFTQSELPRRFRETFGADLNEYWGAIREAVMVRDYVESLVARERATLPQIKNMIEGNFPELNAEYARLSVDYFKDEARSDVERAHFAYRSRQEIAGLGVGSLGGGYDAFEEAYDTSHDKAARSEATFSFDVIKAFPSEMKAAGAIEIDSSLLRLIYEAVRDEMFMADKEARDRIEERLERAADTYQLENPDETSDWTEEDFDKWKEQQREVYETYLSFDEARPELISALEDKESVQQSQAAIAGLRAFIERRKAEQRRKLNARLEVIRKEQAIWEGLRDYSRDARSRFDALERQLFSRTRNIGNRLNTEVDTADRPLQERQEAFFSVIEEAARELGDLASREAQGISTTVSGSAQSFETQLNNKRASKEEFELEEDKRTDDGKSMSEEEIQARLEQFDLEIRAIREKMDLRDERLEPVEAFVESFEARLADYQLRLMSAKDADLTLALGIVRELLAEIPLELGAFVRDRRDEIFPTSELDEYSNQAELIGADYQARQKRLAKEAADTRDWNLTQGTDRDESILKRFGLAVDSVTGNWTWESLIADDRYRWLEQVEGAKEFLESPGNAPGSTSSILSAPGKGYVMLRVMDKKPRYQQGRVEARETILDIATIKRARELTVKAVRKLRRDIIDNGWDNAIADAKQKYGEHLEVGTTGWFTDNFDIPAIYSSSDDDFLDLGSSPSASAPDQPFITRIKDIEPHEGVSKVIPEMRNTDPLRRPQSEQWGYSLARIVDRRLTPRRMSEDNLKQTSWGGSPAEIWRNQHLATSPTVRELVTPALLLKDRSIIEYKIDQDDNAPGEQEDQ